MIGAVLECCAGIDVGKKSVVVCLMTGPADGEAHEQTRRFGTNNGDLEKLRVWLTSCGCFEVVMESTGAYWKPIFNVLERELKVILANAFDVRNRRGHKTDPNDSRWLAHFAAPWDDPAQLRSSTSHSRTARSDQKTQATGFRSLTRTQSYSEDSGRCQCETR